MTQTSVNDLGQLIIVLREVKQMGSLLSGRALCQVIKSLNLNHKTENQFSDLSQFIDPELLELRAGWVLIQKVMKVKVAQPTEQSCSDSLRPHGLCRPWNSPGQNTGACSLSLLQGIFPTQGSNPGFLHCRRIVYQLSHREAQEYWSGQPIPSPAIFPTQEWNEGLLHCRWILYQLSYQGSP